mgnify:CR=1 FL=1
MKLAGEKNHLGGLILYRSPDPTKKRRLRGHLGEFEMSHRKVVQNNLLA